MATRKTKRYDEGGDVRMMGGYSPPPSDDSNRDDIRRISDMRDSMDDATPMPRPSMDGQGHMEYRIPRDLMEDATPMPKPMRDNSVTDEMVNNKGRYKIPSDAKTALQDITSKKAAKDAMVEALMSGMGNQPKVAKIKSSYGGMGGFSAGGSVSKASSRADGIAQRGKTRGTMC